jgi:hypothetical protein
MMAPLCLQVLVQAEDEAMYQVHTPHFTVPTLVPLLQYTFKVGHVVLQHRSLHPTGVQQDMTSL